MLVMKDEACSVPCCLGVGGNKGRGRCTWARVWGAVCDLAQSQPERGLSSGCSAFHLLADGGGLKPGLCPSARCSSGPHVEQRCCLVARGCVPVSLHLGGSWAQLGELGLGWAQPLGVGCCRGLWLLVSLCSPLPPPPSPLYPPEKSCALHAALLPAHCASWQPDLFGIDLSFIGQLNSFFKYVCIIDSKRISVLYSKAFIFLLKLFSNFLCLKKPVLLRCHELLALTVNYFSIFKKKLYILFGSLRKCMCQETCTISSVSCHVQVTAVTPFP